MESFQTGRGIGPGRQPVPGPDERVPVRLAEGVESGAVTGQRLVEGEAVQTVQGQPGSSPVTTLSRAGRYRRRQASLTALQSACSPARLPTAVSASVTPDRQSVDVPNTSNTAASMSLSVVLPRSSKPAATRRKRAAAGDT
ncbi:hypothetical protein [Streptomyces sp. NRRL S-1448]|uniref:hypothetical protein n=1 Tax=Streptomyces sp. NRRL S-1448 TaxID=1463883 RepID=UPI000A990222|nr:hypothetical protein [Streptomyces sp. NRRL S-1448]